MLYLKTIGGVTLKPSRETVDCTDILKVVSVTLVTPDMANERPLKLAPVDTPPFYSLSTSLFLAQPAISGYVVSSHPSPEISCFSN